LGRNGEREGVKERGRERDGRRETFIGADSILGRRRRRRRVY